MRKLRWSDFYGDKITNHDKRKMTRTKPFTIHVVQDGDMLMAAFTNESDALDYAHRFPTSFTREIVVNANDMSEWPEGKTMTDKEDTASLDQALAEVSSAIHAAERAVLEAIRAWERVEQAERRIAHHNSATSGDEYIAKRGVGYARAKIFVLRTLG